MIEESLLKIRKKEVKVKRFICLGLIFLFIESIYAFPLQKLKIGDKINLQNFNAVNLKGEKFKNYKKRKLLFLWRHDKRLSKKSAKKFIKVCRDRKILCISIETKGASIEQQMKILKKVPDTVYFAQNVSDIKNWGIFTLPVTIFLDKNNKIIHAVGYEGQYITKIERYIDFLEGKISKEDINKLEREAPNYRKSVLPDLNYILTLIKENQINDAEKKLTEIKGKLNLKEISSLEKLGYVKVLIKLKKYNDAESVLKTLNKYNPHVKFYRGIICYKKGNYNKALDFLKSIEKIYPDKKLLYFYFGKIYKLKGDYKNAVEYFEKVFNYLNIGI